MKSCLIGIIGFPKFQNWLWNKKHASPVTLQGIMKPTSIIKTGQLYGLTPGSGKWNARTDALEVGVLYFIYYLRRCCCLVPLSNMQEHSRIILWRDVRTWVTLPWREIIYYYISLICYLVSLYMIRYRNLSHYTVHLVRSRAVSLFSFTKPFSIPFLNQSLHGLPQTLKLPVERAD